MDQYKVNELLKLIAARLKEIDAGRTGDQYGELIRDWMRENAPEYWGNNS